ncbi:MAG: hypothetical protein M3Y72_23430 [Acidobacteriota bacterium]|nr:hypothetical protein [Acidobacteriota bacterium]
MAADNQAITKADLLSAMQDLKTYLQSQFLGVERRFEALEGRLGALEGRLEALEGQLGALEGRLGALEGRLGALEGRLGALEGRLGALEGKVEELQGQLQGLRDYIDERTHDAETRLLRAFADYNENAAVRFRKLEADTSNINTSTTVRLGELEKQVTELHIRIMRLESEKGSDRPSAA